MAEYVSSYDSRAGAGVGMLTAMDMRAIWQSASVAAVPEGDAAESVWRARFCSSRLMGR